MRNRRIVLVVVCRGGSSVLMSSQKQEGLMPTDEQNTPVLSVPTLPVDATKLKTLNNGFKYKVTQRAEPIKVFDFFVMMYVDKEVPRSWIQKNPLRHGRFFGASQSIT